MVCQHLSELYELCEKNHLRLGGADLIRIICKQCNQEETCPSVLSDEYDARHLEEHAEHHVEEPLKTIKSPGT